LEKVKRKERKTERGREIKRRGREEKVNEK